MAANGWDSIVRLWVFQNSSVTYISLFFFFFLFFYIWEHDECSFARETTLDVWASCLIGLNWNVFQTAPGAYGRLKPSRGEEGGGEGEKQSRWKKVQKTVCLLILASHLKEEIKLLSQRCSSKLLYDKCISSVTFAFKLIFYLHPIPSTSFLFLIECAAVHARHPPLIRP